jgi:hypothetical protein
MPSSYQFALWKQESFLVPPAFFRNLLENPRPEGAESTLTENAASPFPAEPAHVNYFVFLHFRSPVLSLTARL